MFSRDNYVGVFVAIQYHAELCIQALDYVCSWWVEIEPKFSLITLTKSVVRLVASGRWASFVCNLYIYIFLKIKYHHDYFLLTSIL